MAKMWLWFGGSSPWLTTWAGRGLGELAPHQCRWEGVVWAAHYRDGVIGYCGFFWFCADTSFLVNSHNVYPWAWPPARLFTRALLHHCLPSNLSMTLRAIMKLYKASPAWKFNVHSERHQFWDRKIALALGEWTVLGFVWRRGGGLEGSFGLKKWVQWSPSVGGAQCDFMHWTEKPVTRGTSCTCISFSCSVCVALFYETNIGEVLRSQGFLVSTDLRQPGGSRTLTLHHLAIPPGRSIHCRAVVPGVLACVQVYIL